MRLVLISDTHIPPRARDLPAPLWAAIETADVVVHAGDWVDVEVLERLEQRSARLIGCWGNNDGPELRPGCPERADATLAGVWFTVVHETGAAAGREARMGAPTPTPMCSCSATATSLGHHRAQRASAGQSRLAHRSSPPTVLHLHDRDPGTRETGTGDTGGGQPASAVTRGGRSRLASPLACTARRSTARAPALPFRSPDLLPRPGDRGVKQFPGQQP